MQRVNIYKQLGDEFYNSEGPIRLQLWDTAGQVPLGWCFFVSKQKIYVKANLIAIPSLKLTIFVPEKWMVGKCEFPFWVWSGFYFMVCLNLEFQESCRRCQNFQGLSLHYCKNGWCRYAVICVEFWYVLGNMRKQ